MKNLALPWLLAALFVSIFISRAAEAVPTTNTANTASPVVEADPQMLRSFLLLQEQIRATQHSVDQAREEAQAEAKRATELTAARLNLIEQTLNAQRQQELQSMQNSTHTMLLIVGITTALGFIVMLFAGFMQVRAATRLSEVSRQLQAVLPAARYAELGEGKAGTAAQIGAPVESANASLLGAIDRLEHRLEEMETTAGGTHTATNGHQQITPAATGPSQVATLLNKGQSLLNLNQAEEALDQFDEALRLEPRNLEAWIKRGTALERLQRVDEAITSYDQAIIIDGSTATAYLFKAGVYNRQKKYAEALQCYEKALNAQQRSRAAQTAQA